MKKVFFTFAVLAAVALVSCNNKAKEEAAEAAVDSTEVVAAEVTDTIQAVDAAGDTATVVTDTTVVAETPAK